MTSFIDKPAATHSQAAKTRGGNGMVMSLHFSAMPISSPAHGVRQSGLISIWGSMAMGVTTNSWFIILGFEKRLRSHRSLGCMTFSCHWES